MATYPCIISMPPLASKVSQPRPWFLGSDLTLGTEEIKITETGTPPHPQVLIGTLLTARTSDGVGFVGFV